MNTDTDAANAQLVTDYLTQAWNDGSFDTGVVSDDYVAHVNDPANTYTVAEMQALAATYRDAFPDFHLAVPAVVATDGRVALRYRWTGTHEGPVRGIDPTGQPVEVHGMGHFHVEDGQLDEAWYVEDVHGLLDQLGATGE